MRRARRVGLPDRLHELATATSCSSPTTPACRGLRGWRPRGARVHRVRVIDRAPASARPPTPATPARPPATVSGSCSWTPTRSRRPICCTATSPSRSLTTSARSLVGSPRRRSAPSAGIVARYGAHKNFLDAGAHLAHPFLPRAAAANLLVRRAAFEAVGGFFEGLRAAEDTDFSWRLQRAGWTLAGRPSAAVEHRYRDSFGALRRQWRGYAAGRAWLGRRYDGVRAAAGAAARGTAGAGRVPGAGSPESGRTAAPRAASGTPLCRRCSRTPPGALTGPAPSAAFDAVLGIEELIGFVAVEPAADPRGPVTRQRDRCSSPTGSRRRAGRFGRADADPGAAVGSRPAGAPIGRRSRRRRHDHLPRGRRPAGPSARAGDRSPPVIPAACSRRPPVTGRPLAGGARARRVPAARRAGVTLAPADPSMQAAARRLGRLAGRGSPRRGGWREMLTRQAQSSNRATATGDQATARTRRRSR